MSKSINTVIGSKPDDALKFVTVPMYLRRGKNLYKLSIDQYEYVFTGSQNNLQMLTMEYELTLKLQS